MSKVGSFLLCALLGTSCAAQRVELREGREHVPAQPEMRCVQEWRDVFQQWEPHGSQPATIRGLRSELQRQNHKFAKLVRQARDLQKGQNLGWNGQWPVPKAVIQSVDSTIDAAAIGVVSADCEGSGVYLLAPLLGEEVVSERTSSQLYNLDVSVVDPSRSDTTQIGRWLYYWLLAGD